MVNMKPTTSGEGKKKQAQIDYLMAAVDELFKRTGGRILKKKKWYQFWK